MQGGEVPSEIWCRLYPLPVNSYGMLKCRKIPIFEWSLLLVKLMPKYLAPENLLVRLGDERSFMLTLQFSFLVQHPISEHMPIHPPPLLSRGKRRCLAMEKSRTTSCITWRRDRTVSRYRAWLFLCDVQCQ